MMDPEKQVEKEQRRIRDRMRRSAMTDQERSQQKERRRIEYKRRRDSMSSEELGKEKQIRHEQYLQRRHGTCAESLHSNNARDISDVFGGKLTEGTPTSTFATCSSVDRNVLFQMPYVTHEGPSCSTISNTGECLQKNNTLERKAERERRRIRESMRRSAMTEEQRARHNERRRIQYRRRKDQMNSQHLSREQQNCKDRNLQGQPRDVGNNIYSGTLKKNVDSALLNISPVQPQENQTSSPSDKHETDNFCSTSESKKCCALSADFTAKLTAKDIDYVVDILRDHAAVKASKIVHQREAPLINIMPGRLQLYIDKETSVSSILEFTVDDYIDLYEPNNMKKNQNDEDDLSEGAYEIDSVKDGNTEQLCTLQVDLPKIERQRRKSILQRSFRNCARNYVDSPHHQRFTLPPPRICKHCQARLFSYESDMLCCQGGKIDLPYVDPPSELMHLYSANSPEAKHFRQHIRSYNHVFSFTSLGVHLDTDLAKGCDGIYTYRAQGTMYHRIGSLLPDIGKRPRYLQMYIYNTDHEIEHRLAENTALDRKVLAVLQRVLDSHNVFVHVLRRVSTMPSLNDVRLHLKERRPDQHQYNLPTASQVATILIGGDDPYDLSERDVIVQTKAGHLLNVPDTAGFYDPLQYPLLHPYGEFGWDIHLYNQSKQRISCRAYYCFLLQIRANRDCLLLCSGRLLQQYAVDTYVKISTQQLRYIRDHQHKIRAELYQGLQDSLANGETQACNVGRRIIIPATFIGSPRDMHERYHDAMALVQKFGKPDLFLTMTCNPNWEEIRRELRPGETSQDRPDITTRIFHSKCEELKKDLFVNGVLGKVVAHVIEFQKRGLPHAHILLILDAADKLKNSADYDKVVRADIPDRNVEPDLFRIVMKHMIHGPCDILDKTKTCIKNGKCNRFFPKSFQDYTCEGTDSYPLYKRSSSGPSVKLRNGVIVDNRWVVPYNLWLLRKYDCHINVEVCSTIKCVKYLYKYVYKGSDKVSVEIRSHNAAGVDEIKQFADGRWLCPHEAFWRIFRFPLNKIYPAVYSLQVHLPNMHEVHFPDNPELETLLHDESIKKTMLTEFFHTNSIDPAAKQYLYNKFPEHYTWLKKEKRWKKRIGRTKVVGRMYTATPADPERYYLRLLLNHIKGPMSFDDVKTITIDGTPHTFNTFKYAAEGLGLIDKDNAIRECLNEAVSTQMPSALLNLFSTILIFCNPTDVRQL